MEKKMEELRQQEYLKMQEEKKEREAKAAQAFEEEQKKKQSQGLSSDLPSLGKPAVQKSLFADIDMFEDDSAEVIEEKEQTRTLKQVKIDRLKEQNDFRTQELSDYNQKKAVTPMDEEAAKKERI